MKEYYVIKMLQYTYMIYMRKTLLCLLLLISISASADATTTMSTSTQDILTVATSAPTITFSTVYQDVKLKIPIYKQTYVNSCEAASLRMALAFKKVLKNEIQILTKFGYNPTYKDWVKNIWDDPQKQYVGYVDIEGKPYGGYGVYGLPVASAIKSFGLNAEYATSTAITPSFLANAIDKKNPVVIWGYSSYTDLPYTWNTPQGVEVKAFRGEHVRLLVGFKGSVINPVGFYVHDPLSVKNYEYWTSEKLMENINKVPGVTDQAVVVK